MNLQPLKFFEATVLFMNTQVEDILQKKQDWEKRIEHLRCRGKSLGPGAHEHEIGLSYFPFLVNYAPPPPSSTGRSQIRPPLSESSTSVSLSPNCMGTITENRIQSKYIERSVNCLLAAALSNQTGASELM